MKNRNQLLIWFALSLTACAPHASTFDTEVNPKPGHCVFVDAQPGPFWHAAQQFTKCGEPNGEMSYPPLMQNAPTDLLSNLSSPAQWLADHFQFQAPLAP